MNTRMPEEDPQYWLQRQAIIENYAKKTAHNSQNDQQE